MRHQDALLWNGEYYIQKPGTPPAHDCNTGCHSDQHADEVWTGIEYAVAGLMLWGGWCKRWWIL